MKKSLQIIIPVLLALVIAVVCVSLTRSNENSSVSNSTTASQNQSESEEGYTLDSIPEYSGTPYVILNNNIPDFIEEDLTTESFEYYGRLDELGRCTACYASIGKDLMPTEKRGNISSVKPTGWHSTNYQNVDGGSLYNRCHLIGYQLTAENANERNLITGTRYLNVQGMLPFEDEVANYIRQTGNHVLYRVTPIFKGSELVARGVQMEAISVEDEGEGVCFNVYCYNVQPDIEIDYLTGESKLAKTSSATQEEKSTEASLNINSKYILNISSKKFHSPDCKAIDSIKDKNKQEYEGSRQALIDDGYEPCGQCQP